MPVIVLETVPLSRGDEPDIGLPVWMKPARNAVGLSRHSGMDRRNPDCMDASKPSHPWHRGSGNPCRDDRGILSSSALTHSPPRWGLAGAMRC